jgi:hypothetical protein
VHAFVPYLVIRPRPGAGEDRPLVERLDSDYQRALDAAAGRQYLQFHVASDSFETYLAARSIADRMNVPAGWEPVESARDVKRRLAGDPVCIGHPEPTIPTPPPPPPPGPNGGRHPPPRTTLPGITPNFRID